MEVKQQRTRGRGKWSELEVREGDGIVGEKVLVTFILVQLVTQRKMNPYDL